MTTKFANPAATAAVAAAATALLGGTAMAQETTDTAPAGDDITVAASVGVSNDYAVFGMAQNDGNLSGTASLAFTRDNTTLNFFAGTVSQDLYNGTDGVELDVGLAHRFSAGNGWNVDAGVLAFVYPGQNNDFDAAEGFVTVSNDHVSAKLERIYPFSGAAASTAITLSGSTPIGGDWNLNGSVGRVQPDEGFASNFGSLGVSRSLTDNLSFSVGVTGNDRPIVIDGKNISRARLTAGLNWNF